jgi:hypothetical protein
MAEGPHAGLAAASKTFGGGSSQPSASSRLAGRALLPLLGAAGTAGQARGRVSMGAMGRPKCHDDASAGLSGQQQVRGVETVDVKRRRSNDRSMKAVSDIPTVSVTVVTSRIEAELIVGMLRSAGLRAAVSADDAGGQEPPLQLQGVRVLVAPSDEAAAREFIAAADEAPS